MTSREWVNRHTSSITLMCVLVMLVSLGWIVYQLRIFVHVSTAQPRVWYYDLNTRKLFIGDFAAVPPIEVPSGPLPDGTPAGVLAKVFSYSDCSDPSARFIGWLEKRTPEAKEAILRVQASSEQAPTAELSIKYHEGLLIQATDGYGWVRANSDEGRRLMQAPHLNCPPGSILHSCFPD